MGFNVGPTSGVASAAEFSSQTFSAKAYMEGVLNTLANANASTPPSVILNCYQFLNAMENSQNFNVTMGPDGQPITSNVHQTFDFSFLTDAQKATLKADSDTLFKSYSEKVQDPNDNDNPNNQDLNLKDAAGNNVTLYEMLTNPNATYTVEAHCHGDIINPTWAENLSDNYDDRTFWNNDNSNDGTTFAATGANGQPNGINVSVDCQSDYHGGGTNFTASGTGTSWESCATIQASAGTAAAESALATFLDKNM